MAKSSNNIKSAPKADRQNTGRRGARKNPQSAEALIHLGKGMFRTMKPISGPPYRGQETVAQNNLFDAKQSQINKELGYW